MRYFIFCIALTFSIDASAGYYMEHEAIMPNPQTLVPAKVKVRSWQEGSDYKRESPDNHEVIIVDGKKGIVFGIDHTKKSYWKLSAEQYSSISKMSLLVMGVQVFPNGSISVPENLFQKTGKSKKVSGFSAIEIKVGGALPPGVEQSFWVAEEVKIPMTSMVDKLRHSLGNPKDPEYKKLFGQWLAINAYPVQAITTLSVPGRGKVIASETLVKYESRKIPKNTFAIPAEYSLTEDPITIAQRAMQQQQQLPTQGATSGNKGGQK